MTIQVHSLAMISIETKYQGLAGKLCTVHEINDGVATVIIFNAPVGEGEYKIPMDHLIHYIPSDCTTVYAYNHLRDIHKAYEARATEAWNTTVNFIHDNAEERDWCDEFDTAVDVLNGKLPTGWHFRERSREYCVEWNETYTVTVRRSENVVACNDEDAIEIAQSNFNSSMWYPDRQLLIDAVQQDAFNYEDADDYFAEVL